MASRSLRRTSLWIDTAPSTQYPSLSRDLSVDVAVLGGGVVGLTTALLLQREGLQVAVLEGDRIALGVSAKSTVKVTAGHGLVYSELERRFDLDAARIYAEANAAGFELIAGLVEELSIDCDLERLPNCVWGETPEERDTLQHEAEIERAVGLPTSLQDEAPELPFPVMALLRMEDQAQFHPRRFLLGLAEAIVAGGGFVLENSRALAVREGHRSRVSTSNGTVDAEHVVVATHYPFLLRGLFFAKLYPYREYALAVPLGRRRLDAMYINAGSPTRSIRRAPAEGGDLLVVVGEGHKVGEAADTERSYDALLDWTNASFGRRTPRYRWSTQDNYSMDRLPFVGRAGRTSSRTWLATGFGAWGMTNAAAAAMILRDGILGRENPWAARFDPQRVTPIQSAPDFSKENAKVALHFFGDRVRALTGSVGDLPAGDGRVVRSGLRPVAVARDDEGAVHAVSAVCTHLRCIVQWNRAERSWDCPCHGSRFAMDGDVLHGPATAPLRRVALDDDAEAPGGAPFLEDPG